MELFTFYFPVLSVYFHSRESKYILCFSLLFFCSCFCFSFRTPIHKHKQYIVDLFLFESFIKMVLNYIQLSTSIFPQYYVSKFCLFARRQWSILIHHDFFNHSLVDVIRVFSSFALFLICSAAINIVRFIFFVCI